MDPSLRRWYEFIRSSECCSCGSWGMLDNPIEAAHVLTVVSRKSRSVMPRSHKGLAAWGCVPLCRSCHLELHEVGEDAFFEILGKPRGAIWGTLLLEFGLSTGFLDGDDDE